MLRIDSVEHHRVNETLPRETYTINDRVVRSSVHMICWMNLTVVPYRRIPHTSRSITLSWIFGSRTPASRTCSSSSRCSTRISAPHCPPSQVSRASTRSPSEYRTGTAYSSLSTTTSAKGEYPHTLLWLTSCVLICSVSAQVDISHE